MRLVCWEEVVNYLNLVISQELTYEGQKCRVWACWPIESEREVQVWQLLITYRSCLACLTGMTSGIINSWDNIKCTVICIVRMFGARPLLNELVWWYKIIESIVSFIYDSPALLLQSWLKYNLICSDVKW